MANYIDKFRYNLEKSASYSMHYGFDIYRAEFEASIPRKPLRLRVGFWFLDIRFFKWQILINKMTRSQIERYLQSRHDDHNDFSNPTLSF